MNQITQSYIDRLIRSKVKSHDVYYDVSANKLTSKEFKDCIDYLFQHDRKLTDIVEEHIDELIYERIGTVNSEDNYERGLRPRKDPQTGEMIWEKPGVL